MELSGSGTSGFSTRYKCFDIPVPRGSEELVEQLVELDASFVRLRDAVFLEEQRHPLRAVVVGQAAGGEGEVLVAVGDDGTAPVDEAAESLALDEDVGKAIVAVGEDPVLHGRLRASKLLEEVGGRAALASLVEVDFVHPAAAHTDASRFDLPIERVIEGAVHDREAVDLTQ